MVFQPGVSGNPNGGGNSTRRERHKAIFEEIKKLGHKDALMTLSTIQDNEQNEPSLRIAAASALAPFAHPKLQAIPVAYYIEHPIDIPQFHTISEAADFLAKIPALYFSGQIDAASSDRATAQITAWIEAKKSSEFEERLTIVEQAIDRAPPNGRTHSVAGGLPQLPGTSVIMPDDNGPTTKDPDP